MDAEENKVEDTDGKKFSIPSARGRRRTPAGSLRVSLSFPCPPKHGGQGVDKT